MCGIAGIVSFDGQPVSSDELRAMCAAIVHRGPDDEGTYLGDGVGLAMRRLSIIDLGTGHQPVCNEDGSIWVVFNGEIYNYRTLREELEREGHRFYTATDTEVLVHLYEQYGDRSVERLRGMFAYALWDERRRRVLLARDRLGIKPLYYARVAGRLIFASELKALLQLSDTPRSLNWSAVAHCFSFLTTPRSDSIIEGVRKLEPAHVLTASAQHDISLRRYWDLRFDGAERRSEEYYVERLQELIEESVRLHLVSDVPVGAFLSGGIDSSAVVGTMARMTTGRVRTFSIGFADREYNELDHARVVAERFGTDHHELILEPDVLDTLDDLAWHLDEPFGDSSAIPTYMVSKLAAEHVKVVLSGDGGDELFAGYEKYLVERRERQVQLGPASRRLLGLAAGLIPEGVRGRNFLQHRSLAGADRYLDASTLFKLDQKRRLFQPDVFALMAGADPLGEWSRYLAAGNGGWLSAAQYLDLMTYLPLDILSKVDRMSMAHSIEARVPLLDHKVVEFAATIPPELQLQNGTTKYIFKRALNGLVPDGILERRKQGFAVPLGRWFRGNLEGFVRDLLLSDTSRRRGIFNPAYIEQLVRWHQNGRALDLQLWTLLSFELWCRTFLDRAAPVPARATGSERLLAV